MDDLRPCPFCGSKPIMEISEDVRLGIIELANCVCRNCGASSPLIQVRSTPYFEVRMQKLWNTRPLEDALRAELETARARIAELELLYQMAQGRIELGDKLVAEQAKKLDAASDLLESISRWFYKNVGMPTPMWTDQYDAVCKLFMADQYDTSHEGLIPQPPEPQP